LEKLTNNPSSAVPSSRALALDALRGLAILAMLLSGQMPFGHNALPSWMYHAQEPPPHFEWIGTLAGISWVDLVFPFFLFAMGAAFPLALARRMEKPAPTWKLLGFILERGFLLAFFALFVMAIRPYVLSEQATTATWIEALLGFFALFPILTRLPADWSPTVKAAVRAAGWLAVILFFIFQKYPDGSGFKLTRSDIIIVVLANMAVFGSLVWMLTRQRLLPRLGLLGILVAIRLSNMPQPADGWVHDLWTLTQKWWPAWICQLYYLQYLNIVIPGMIAGDLILEWTRQLRPAGPLRDTSSWSLQRYVLIGALMTGLVLFLLIGLKARWLMSVTLGGFTLCFIAWKLVQNPLNDTERLYHKLFLWAAYWLVLGLVFEPYEGGIKKDHPTMSYYFITSGMAICVYIAFSILIDVFQQKKWLRLLIDNGQNPMIAYAGINNFIIPVLALTGASTLLADFVTTPWRGFWRGAIITLLLALTVSFLTRRKIFWRT
jgi:predicted acyltransferase